MVLRLVGLMNFMLSLSRPMCIQGIDANSRNFFLIKNKKSGSMFTIQDSSTVISLI